MVVLCCAASFVQGAALFPAAAIRSDLGIALTSLRFLGPEMLTTGLVANQLTVSVLASAFDKHTCAEFVLRELIPWLAGFVSFFIS